MNFEFDNMGPLENRLQPQRTSAAPDTEKTTIVTPTETVIPPTVRDIKQAAKEVAPQDSVISTDQQSEGFTDHSQLSGPEQTRLAVLTANKVTRQDDSLKIEFPDEDSDGGFDETGSQSLVANPPVLGDGLQSYLGDIQQDQQLKDIMG